MARRARQDGGSDASAASAAGSDERPVARIVDVARLAGASPASVSRVLNGVATVDPDLAERVRAAALELDYRPNGAARNLRRRRADVVAVIISDVANPFFTSLARGAEDAAQQHGFSVLLGNSDEDPDKESQYLRVAVQEQVAGVILSPNHSHPDVAVVRRAGIPVCVVDRDLGEGFDTVRADSEAAGRLAAEHLIERGWQRLACVTGPHEAYTADRRLLGFREAHASAGRRVPAALVRHTDFRAAQAQDAVATLLDLRNPPDALFAANSAIALGALAECAERGLRPGRDLGLVAVDDAPWAGLVAPPLTVVAQPAHEIGRRAVETLLARVQGADAAPPHHEVLGVELIVRETSGPPGRAAESV